MDSGRKALRGGQLGGGKYIQENPHGKIAVKFRKENGTELDENFH